MWTPPILVRTCSIVIDAFAARFLALPSEHARHTLVLWCAHSWLMDCWNHTPRLLFISPEAGCGKTRALTVTQPVGATAGSRRRPDTGCAVPLHRRGAGSARVVGRRSCSTSSTPLFGNAETRPNPQRGDAPTDQRRSRPQREPRPQDGQARPSCSRCTPRWRWPGRWPLTYVPATIRSRSHHHPDAAPHCRTRMPNGGTAAIHEAEAEPLRWLLQCWAELVHSYALDYVGPDRPVLPKGIEDRDADVWEPLLAMAELAGGHWPERARVAAVAAVAADGVKTTPSPRHRAAGRHQGRLRPTARPSDLHAEPAGRAGQIDRRWRRSGRQEAGRHAATATG